MTTEATAAVDLPIWSEATVTLKFPLTLPDGTTVSTITLREPDADPHPSCQRQNVRALERQCLDNRAIWYRRHS